VNNFSYEAHPAEALKALHGVLHPNTCRPIAEYLIPRSALRTCDAHHGLLREYVRFVSLFADVVISEDVEVYTDSRYGQFALAVRACAPLPAHQRVFGLSGILTLIPEQPPGMQPNFLSVAEIRSADPRKAVVPIRTHQQVRAAVSRRRNARATRRSHAASRRTQSRVSSNRKCWYMMSGPLALINHACASHATAIAGVIDQGVMRAAWQQCSVTRAILRGEEITIDYGTGADSRLRCVYC
jgi:hypothetical protein